MQLKQPRWLRALLLAAAGTAAALAAAAEPKHDLYVCANVSGQAQVMGSRVASPSGLYRSVDRQTFVPMGFAHIRLFTLTHDVREPSTLFLATLDGVVRARNHGANWRIMTGWDMTEPKSIAFDPNAPDRIYAGLPDGIAVSTDRGQTWRRQNEGIARRYTQTITVDRTRAGRVLAGTEKGIFLTEDGAKTWRLVQPTDKTTYDLRQSPHDPKEFFAVTSSDGAFRSRDGGATWQPVPSVPKERTLHNFDYDRREAKRLVYGGWGTGVQLSEDGGATWTDRTAGLPNREIWRVALDPDIPGRLYAAPYQQPLFVSDDLGATWRPLHFEKAIVFDLVFVPRS